MWLTENPPRANPASPSVALVAVSPAGTDRAMGMASRASPAPQNPACKAQLSSLQTAQRPTRGVRCRWGTHHPMSPACKADLSSLQTVHSARPECSLQMGYGQPLSRLLYRTACSRHGLYHCTDAAA